jgi:hypothetical protein
MLQDAQIESLLHLLQAGEVCDDDDVLPEDVALEHRPIPLHPESQAHQASLCMSYDLSATP